MTPKQEKALAALISCPTAKAAARTAGLSESALRRYYAKSYIDCYREYSAAVAAEKAARAALENEYNDHSITKATFEAKLATILETAPKEVEFRKKADKIVADFDAAYSAWIAPDGSKVDEADLKVLNPVFITCSTDLQHIADRHRKNPTMCKPIRKYAAEKGFNIRIKNRKPLNT